MNVYSIVPSQRSQATVSVRISKMTPRYAQTTAPTSSWVVSAVDVDVAAGRLDALADEDDRERVRDRPDEERDVPPDVAADEVHVALEDAAEADQLVARTLQRRASVVVLLVSLLVLERLAGRGEERLLERLGAVALA